MLRIWLNPGLNLTIFRGTGLDLLMESMILNDKSLKGQSDSPQAYTMTKIEKTSYRHSPLHITREYIYGYKFK